MKKNNNMVRACLLFLPSILSFWSGGAQAHWSLDLASEVVIHDNLSLAEKESDIVSDTGLSLGLEAGYFKQIATLTGLTVSGNLNRTVHKDLNGLDRYSLGAAVNLRHKFGIGDLVPRLNLGLSIGRDNYDQKPRDAGTYTASLTLSKRLHPGLDLAAGLLAEKRDAKLAPFDVSGWHLISRASLDISARDWISAGYDYRDGRVTSSGLPTPRLWNASDQVSTPDDAFGPERPFVTYRLPAVTHLLALDWNRALLQTGTIYLGVEYRQTRGNYNIDYSVTMFRGGFLYSFDL